MKISHKITFALMLLGMWPLHSMQALQQFNVDKKIIGEAIGVIGLGYLYSFTATSLHELGHAAAANFLIAPSCVRVVIGSQAALKPSKFFTVNGWNPFTGYTDFKFPYSITPLTKNVEIGLCAMGPLVGLLFNSSAQVLWVLYGHKLKLNPVSHFAISSILLISAFGDVRSCIPVGNSDGKRICSALKVNPKWGYLLAGTAAIPNITLFLKSTVFSK